MKEKSQSKKINLKYIHMKILFFLHFKVNQSLFLLIKICVLTDNVALSFVLFVLNSKIWHYPYNNEKCKKNILISKGF